MARTYLALAVLACTTTLAAATPDERAIADKVDFLIASGLRDAGVDVAEQCNDADFLRRVSLDLAGTLPTPAAVLAFEADRDPDKRWQVVRRLLDSPAYGRTWAAYWREVILSRATNQRARLVQNRFDAWMSEQLAENTPWDEITTELLTATGDVREVGSTALVFAHEGEAAEIAAETSRIFLGIQLSCANCHDHPYDSWKREDFHTLAAYFPRIRVRRVMEEGKPNSFAVVSFDRGNPRGANGPRDLKAAAPFIVRRFDANRDGKLSKEEMEGSPLQRIVQRGLDLVDTDGDGMLTLKEIQSFEIPQQAMRRTQTEYLMPDLANPGSPGDRMDPSFFVSREAAATEMSDADRRLVLAQQITEAKNPWFAKAYVNRIWSELLGEGFHHPVDDLGPERSARFPEALETLSAAFTESGYDVQWLFRTITRTQAYQRVVRSPEPGQPLPFASALPTRLRPDAVFDSLLQSLGLTEAEVFRLAAQQRQRNRTPGFGGPRAQFGQLFGHDPSTPHEDVLGTVPQALFLMNSPVVNELIRTNTPTKLGTMLYRHRDDEKAVEQVYLTVLARRPSEREYEICLEHIASGDHRGEAYEDLMWSLLNSTEFMTRR